MAKKVDAEGFTFVAKQIRKAKTVEGARKALANAKARAGEATGDSGKNKLGNTGSAVSLVGMFAAAGVTLFAGKRRGVSRHCSK